MAALPTLTPTPPPIPHNLELEQAVLGAIMLEKEAIHEVIDLLHENLFFVNKHKEACRAVIELHKEGIGIDILTVTQKARVLGLSLTALEVTQLTARVNQSANLEYHVRILQQLSIKRQIISVTALVNSEAYKVSSDPFELRERLENALEMDLNDTKTPSLFDTSLKLLDSLKEFRETGEVKGGVIASDNLARYLHAYQPKKLYIMAGRPAMGKTAAALNDALNCALNGVPTVYFSLEVGAEEMTQRLLANLTGINAEKISLGVFSESEEQIIKNKIEQIKELPLYIVDCSTLNITELKAKCKRLKNKHKIQCCFVDYLQLMSGEKGGTREQEVSSISRGLKMIAKDLDIAMIALAQLSRSVEMTADKKPMLQHLRESGAIEQDADVVIFLYRPSYYGIEEDEEGNPIDFRTLVYLIPKHRGGRTGEAQTGIDLRVSKVCDSIIPQPVKEEELELEFEKHGKV